jgi:hypothetical protein
VSGPSAHGNPSHRPGPATFLLTPLLGHYPLPLSAQEPPDGGGASADDAEASADHSAMKWYAGLERTDCDWQWKELRLAEGGPGGGDNASAPRVTGNLVFVNMDGARNGMGGRSLSEAFLALPQPPPTGIRFF